MAWAGLKRRDAGGIRELCRIAAGLKKEVAADFRDIYKTSVYSVPSHELWQLLWMLFANTASRTFAAYARWEYPLSREGMALLEIWDTGNLANLLAVGKGKKFKPHPKPWPDENMTKKKTGTARSAVEVLAILRPTP